MVKLARHIFIWLSAFALILQSCNQTTIFRPRVSCEFPANYGLVFIAGDSVKGGSRLYFVDFILRDTMSLKIESFLPQTMVYARQNQAVIFLDSSNNLIMADSSGNIMNISGFDWRASMLEFDSDDNILFGVRNDSVKLIFCYSLTKMNFTFTDTFPADFEINRSIYFYDPDNNIYYLGVRYNDTSWVLGYDHTGLLQSKAYYARALVNTIYNRNDGLAYGLDYDGTGVELVSFDPVFGDEVNKVVVPLDTIMQGLKGFEASRQYYVAGEQRDTGFVFYFLNLQTGNVAETHSFKVKQVSDYVAWSSLSYK